MHRARNVVAGISSLGVATLLFVASACSSTEGPGDESSSYGEAQSGRSGRSGSASGRSGSSAKATDSSGRSGGSGQKDTSGSSGKSDAGPPKPAVPKVPAEPTFSLDEKGVTTITASVWTNQVGYEQFGPKRAAIRANGALEKFQVVRKSDGKVLGEGKLTATKGAPGWPDEKDSWFVADFSDVVWPGTYRILVNGKYSESFDIGGHLLFDKTVDLVLGYFKGDRADDADVMKADSAVSVFGGSTKRDVRGGWYDASGDISKYLSHLSYANFLNPQQIPLVAWSLAWVSDEATEQLGTRKSAAQSEAQWGGDFLVRMLDESGFFYITVFDNWSGNLSSRELCSFEGQGGAKSAKYQAAFREGAGMSIAALARMSRWGKAAPFTDYLAAAKKAFAHVSEKGPSYCDDGKENVIDDYTALLAATELFAATKDDAYLKAARVRAGALHDRLSSTGYFVADSGTRPYWHASDAGLPIVALATYAKVETDATSRTEAIDTIRTHLDYLVKVTGEVANPFGYARQHVSASKSGFFVPHVNESKYWWQGENARLGSLAAAALIGGRLLEDDDAGWIGVTTPLAAYATDQVDWILGKNPFDVTFMDGVGRNNPPPYAGGKPQGGHLRGGIVNGVTGEAEDGSGIQWVAQGSGENWRWNEQWIPHAAWYLVAVTAFAQSALPE